MGLMPTEFEKKMNIFIKEKTPDIMKGIDIGIKIEEMGIVFYGKGAEKFPHIREMFLFLQNQEREHLSLLKEMKDSLLEAGKWKRPVFSRARAPDIFGKQGKNQHETSAILDALEAEQLSRKFYDNLAKKAKNPEGADFFRKLAEFEETHERLLSGLLDQEGFRMQS